MVQACTQAFLVVVLLAAGPAAALDIIPVFVDSPDRPWAPHEKAVIHQAIADYEAVIAEPETIRVAFKVHEGDDHLAMWYGVGEPANGATIRPWTSQLRHTVALSTAVADALWYDLTPATDRDVPDDVWDALTVFRHELGHMLGHRGGYCFDKWATRRQHDPWAALVDKRGVFDPGGLNVPIHGKTLGHTEGGGLMTPVIPPGTRYDVDRTVRMLALAYGYKTYLLPLASASAVGETVRPGWVERAPMIALAPVICQATWRFSPGARREC